MVLNHRRGPNLTRPARPVAWPFWARRPRVLPFWLPAGLAPAQVVAQGRGLAGLALGPLARFVRALSPNLATKLVFAAHLVPILANKLTFPAHLTSHPLGAPHQLEEGRRTNKTLK